MAEIIKIQLAPEVALVAHYGGAGTLNFQLDFIEVDPQGRRLEKHASALTAEQARLLWDMFKVKAEEDKVKAEKSSRRAAVDPG